MKLQAIKNAKTPTIPTTIAVFRELAPPEARVNLEYIQAETPTAKNSATTAADICLTILAFA